MKKIYKVVQRATAGVGSQDLNAVSMHLQLNSNQWAPKYTVMTNSDDAIG